MKRFVIMGCSVLAAFEVFASAITTKDVEEAFSRDTIIISKDMLMQKQIYEDIEKELLRNKELREGEAWVKIIMDSFYDFNEYLMTDTKEDLFIKRTRVDDRCMVFQIVLRYMRRYIATREKILEIADSIGRIVPREEKGRFWIGKDYERCYQSSLKGYRWWICEACADLIKELKKVEKMDDKEVDSLIEEFCRRAKVTDAHEVKIFSYSVYDRRYVPTKAEREEAMKRKGWVK